jgi:hypothetical protein
MGRTVIGISLGSRSLVVIGQVGCGPAGAPIGSHHRAWHASSLRRSNIRGTRPLFSFPDVEVNPVTHLKMIEGALLHFRMVEK